MTPAQAARAYLERGWHPIALWPIDRSTRACRCPRGSTCPSGGKHPIRRGWQADGEVHLEDFDGDVNVGLVTGPRSGFFVLDLDTPEGLAELLTKGVLPDTYEVRTGGGGGQRYFAMPDFPVTNRDSMLPAGVDIRGDGGQVVAPPSVSHKGDYAVVHDIPIAPAPDWLLDLLRQPAAAPERPAAPPAGQNGSTRPQTPREAALEASIVGGELARLDELSVPWHEGAGWDKTTFEVACQLLELANADWSTLTPEEARWLIEEHAPTDDSWTLRDVYAKWNSATRAIGANARRGPHDGEDPSDPFSATYAGPARPLTRSAIGGPGSSDAPLDALDAALDAAAAFDRAVALAAWNIRVRNAARELVRVQEAPPAEPFDSGLLSELLLRPPDPPMRVDGLIPSDGGILLVAQRKTGKTTFMLNWARSLITGEPMLGSFPVRPLTGKVGILNYEVSGATFARWAGEVGVPADRLFVVNVRGRRNPLSDDEDRAHLAQLLRSHGVEALAIDPFGRAYPGESQNDSGEVGKWLCLLDRFCRTEVGATDLMLSAHAGWNGERSRGSSALEDWADTIITLTRNEDTADTQRFIRALGRDVDVPEDSLEFNPATRALTMSGEGSRKEAKVATKLNRLSVLVERVVAGRPGITSRQLEQAVREQEDAPAFQKGDVAKAARLAETRGLLRLVTEGPGLPVMHYSEARSS